ncbi:hypothetical protein QNI16_19350 [Cytophagaceae bacterium YF14B1]|uniref:Uncharacterized protein n=1 Tax=Xanthocytophaga flava TaxID=3048013 RepID=A0AAE3QSX9_9BACT|nr:hypothetical protein [Xanthocytophaga flavus]MDJ1482665.1 hypothetical protein [Xanthocytophaga flavus]
MDVLTDQQNRAEARQLLPSPKRYMASNEFCPSVEIPAEKLK